MSRIGKAPINVPDGVDLKIDGTNVFIKGKIGELSRVFPRTIKIKQEGNILYVSATSSLYSMELNQIGAKYK